MNFLKRKSRGSGVAPGDVFLKVGTYSGQWVVQRILEYPDIPPHARLVERNGTRAITMALTALLDPSNFSRIIIPIELAEESA